MPGCKSHESVPDGCQKSGLVNDVWYEINRHNYSGYFYPDFDCEKGGAAILDALKHHDENFSEYRRKATAYLETVSPHNPQNIAIYDQAIVALFEKD